MKSDAALTPVTEKGPALKLLLGSWICIVALRLIESNDGFLTAAETFRYCNVDATSVRPDAVLIKVILTRSEPPPQLSSYPRLSLLIEKLTHWEQHSHWAYSPKS